MTEKKEQERGQEPPDTRRDTGSLLVAFAAVVALYTLYIVMVGGDHFPGGRFFVPLLAPMILLAQEGVRWALPRLPWGRPARAAAAGLLAIGLGAYVVTSVWQQEPQGRWRGAQIVTPAS